MNLSLCDLKLTLWLRRWSLNLASGVSWGWGRTLGIGKGREANLRCELCVPGRDGRRDTRTWRWQSLDLSSGARRLVLPEKWLWGPWVPPGPSSAHTPCDSPEHQSPASPGHFLGASGRGSGPPTEAALGSRSHTWLLPGWEGQPGPQFIAGQRASAQCSPAGDSGFCHLTLRSLSGGLT